MLYAVLVIGTPRLWIKRSRSDTRDPFPIKREEEAPREPTFLLLFLQKQFKPEGGFITIFITNLH